MSYSDMMGWYKDFCLNYTEAYDTEDEHWTFIYGSKVFFGEEYTNIITQDGDKGKYYDRFEGRYIKREEKKLPFEDRFKSIPKRGLVAIIWNNGAEERFWYKNNLGKELLVEYKGGKCEICGYNKCIQALEFHHLNPEEKDFGIGAKGYTRSIEKNKEEVDKCIMVCANCHREIHSGIIKINNIL